MLFIELLRNSKRNSEMMGRGKKKSYKPQRPIVSRFCHWDRGGGGEGGQEAETRWSSLSGTDQHNRNQPLCTLALSKNIRPPQILHLPLLQAMYGRDQFMTLSISWFIRSNGSTYWPFINYTN